jgi:hypothetical protein
LYRLRPELLPTVSSTAKKNGLSLVSLADRYATAPKEPLKVAATLLTPYVPTEADGALHLDSILSWAVVSSYPAPLTFGDGGAVVPIPLEILWLSPEGLPLWAASDLRPQGEAVRAREYWCKRYPADRAEFSSKINANTSAGRYKECRMPMATIRVPSLRGLCIGNRQEIERLLLGVTHVGKRPGMGFGRVARWSVEPLAEELSVVRRAIVQARPVPVEYFSHSGTVASSSRIKFYGQGWTPPYWYVPWHRPCVEPAT